MLEEKQARELARHWVEAWNAHDLDAIMAHYAESVVLVSPVAVRLLGNPFGTVSERDALRSYFALGLKAYPQLRFDLLDVMWGLNSVVLYYANQRGSKTGEFMELDSTGKVCRVVANYSA
jgi:hypothetical protein